MNYLQIKFLQRSTETLPVHKNIRLNFNRIITETIIKTVLTQTDKAPSQNGNGACY